VQLVLGSTQSTLMPDDQRLLEGALRSCERLAGIVHDILDISTIESARPAGGRRPIVIERLVLDALFDTGLLAEERAVHVETSVAADLPLARGDHDRLVHVFVMLLTRAIAAAPAGSSVTLRARRDQAWVVLDVHSAGNALPPGLSFGGVLELPTALVEQCGGRLTIKRSDVGGTRFIVRLRQSDDVRMQAPRVTPATVFPRGGQAIQPGGARILLADDDPDLRDIVSEALQSQGFTVFTARDGVQADALLAAEAIDLAILDLRMPLRSGGEVIRGIRHGTRQPGLPILVLTGSIDEREAPDSLGADVLLTKPTDLRRLIAEVSALLARPAAASRPHSPYGTPMGRHTIGTS
jgi:CheY-like chemotaxis protein